MVLSYYEEIINTRCNTRFIGFITKNGSLLNTGDKHYIYGVDFYIERILSINTQDELEEFCEELFSNYEINKRILFNREIREPEIYNLLVLQRFLISVISKSKNYIEFLGSMKDFLLRTNDFYVQVLNYDKVERINRTITTSRLDYLKYFYNYLIVDFDILKIQNYRYDENINKLVESSNIIKEDLLEEISLIKTLLYDSRKLYFK